MLTADAVADLTTSTCIGGGIGRATLGALLVLRTEVIDLRTEDEIHPRSGWLFATAEEDAPTEDHRRGGSPLVGVDVAPLSVGREDAHTDSVAEVDGVVEELARLLLSVLILVDRRVLHTTEIAEAAEEGMTSDADAERSVVEVIRAVEALDLAEGTKTATEREDRLAVEERGGVGVEMRYIALTIVVPPEGCRLRALSILEDRQGTCPLDLLGLQRGGSAEPGCEQQARCCGIPG